MARHCSPQRRRPLHPNRSVVATRRAGGGGVRRSAPLDSPLTRGFTAVAVAGGALTLVAAAVPVADLPDDQEAAAVLRVSAPTAAGPGQVLAPPGLGPVTLVAATSEPDVADAESLRKVVQRATDEAQRLAEETRAAEEAEAERLAAQERARAAQVAEEAEQAAARSGGPDCGLSTSGLGAVKAHVATAARFLGCQFGQPTMLGVGSRGGASDHPRGLALDMMTRGATGDAIAACALQNMRALGITYVIWQQRINYGSGWQGMADRGGDTANHMDHVHLSFASGRGSGNPVAC